MTTRWERGAYVADADGLALRGYDPVAYHTEGRAVRGQTGLEAAWGGSRWWFATPEHRDLFLREPETFAPQLGGYCAFAVSHSDRPGAPPAPAGSPRLWTIENDRLYLNNNLVAHLLFRLFHRAPQALAVYQRLSR